MLTILIISTLAIFTASASAQNIQVEGLQESEINKSFEKDGVRFTNDYLNKSVSYEKLLIPESYRQDLNGFDAQYEKDASESELSIDFGFVGADEAQEIPSLLHGYQYEAEVDIDGDSYSWSISSQVDNETITEDASFEVDIDKEDYEKDLEGELDREEDDGDTVVFESEAVSLNNTEGGETFTLDSGLLNPDINSHYEHLVVDYSIENSMNTNYSSEIDSKQNVYSGNDSEKVTFSAETKELDNGGLRQDITYDNLYEPGEWEVLYLIRPNNSEIESIDFSGMPHYKVDVDYESFVKKELNDAGINSSLILDQISSDLDVVAYNVSVPSDSNKTISTVFNPNHGVETGDGGLKVDSRQFYSYIIGSGGALTVDSSATYCGDITDGNGNLYSTILINETVNVCDYDGTAGSGTVNFTATDWVNVTSYGKIDASGSGYSGGNGGSFTNDGNCDSSDGDSGTSGSGPLSGSGGGFSVSCGDVIADANGGKLASIDLNSTNYEYGIGSGGGGAGVADISNDGNDFYGGDGGRGGGAVYIDAENNIVVEGVINATGATGGDASIGYTFGLDGSYALGGGSGGSGGSIVLNTSLVDVTGGLYAEGGSGGVKIEGGNNGYADDGDGSEGGYIKVFYKEGFKNSSITKSVSSGSSDYNTGSPGSYHVERNEAVPSLSVPTYILNKASGVEELNFTIDDFKEKDIGQQSGVSTPSVFSNQTLTASISAPYISSVNVTDFVGFTSDTRSVDLSNTDTGLQQTDGFVSDVSEQRVNQSVEICNNAASEKLNYSLYLENRGTVVTAESWTGQISSSSCTEKTGVWSNDWIQENQFQKKFLNGSSIVTDETEGVRFNRSWTHDSASEIDLDIQINHSTQYKNSVWNNNSNSVKTVPSQAGSFEWSTVKVSGVPVPNIGTDNGARCPDGYTDFGSYCRQSVNADNDTEYTYLKFVSPATNLTENQSIDTLFDDAILQDWSKRNNVEGIIDDKTGNVSLGYDSSGATVTAEDDFSNSSLHEGYTYNISLSYDDSGGSTGGGGTGGGGGGGGTGETSLTAEFVSNTIEAVPGRVASGEFTVENKDDEEVNVTVTVPNTAGCGVFDVEKEPNSNTFGDEGVYGLPATQPFSGQDFRDSIRVQVMIPEDVDPGSQKVYSCEVETSTNSGRAGDLVLKASPKPSVWNRLFGTGTDGLNQALRENGLGVAAGVVLFLGLVAGLLRL